MAERSPENRGPATINCLSRRSLLQGLVVGGVACNYKNLIQEALAAHQNNDDDGFMTPAEVPENLRAAHTIVLEDPELHAWYKKTLLEWHAHLLKYLEQVALVSNKDAFRDGDECVTDPSAAKLEYCLLIANRIKANEQHLLAVMTAAGIETNPHVKERFLRSTPPMYMARLNEDSLPRATSSHVNIGIRETRNPPDFRHRVTRSECGVVIQSPPENTKNPPLIFDIDLIEELNVPLPRLTHNARLGKEFLADSIAELLACEIGQLEGSPEATIEYPPTVACAALLSSVDREALMNWYMGIITTKEAYNKLLLGLIARGVEEREALGVLNRTFENRNGLYEDHNAAAWSLAMALQRGAKKDPAELTYDQKLPPCVVAILKEYDIGALREMSADDIAALCDNDENYLSRDTDRRIEVPVRAIGTHIYLNNPGNDTALSAIALGLGRSDVIARDILEKICERNPDNGTVHRRLGRACDGFSRPAAMIDETQLNPFNPNSYESAVTAYRKALVLNPQDSSAQFNLALLQLKYHLATLQEGQHPDCVIMERSTSVIRGCMNDPSLRPFDALERLEECIAPGNQTSWEWLLKQKDENTLYFLQAMARMGSFT